MTMADEFETEVKKINSDSIRAALLNYHNEVESAKAAVLAEIAMNEALAKIDRRLQQQNDQLNKTLRLEFKNLNDRIDRLEARMDRRFDRMDRRIDGLSGRIGSIERRRKKD